MIEPSVLSAYKADTAERELIEITWRMLHSIHTGDVHTYAELSCDDLSCYEDVCVYRIDGLEFHLALIRLMAEAKENSPARFDILHPRVQLYGDTGIVTYTRLMTFDDEGHPLWRTYNETRVFIRQNGKWKMAHFHRTTT